MKDSVFIKAPAKLNLFLHIVGQNNNGYHKIRTGITFIDLYDEINISLNDKNQVSAPTSKELDVTESAAVRHYLKDNRFDLVIHCANHHVHPAIKTGREPDLQLKNNLKMYFNIASCSELFGNLIYFGSGAEFNRDRWGLKMKEDFFDNSIPNDQYGFSKYL